MRPRQASSRVTRIRKAWTPSLGADPLQIAAGGLDQDVVAGQGDDQVVHAVDADGLEAGHQKGHLQHLQHQRALGRVGHQQQGQEHGQEGEQEEHERTFQALALAPLHLEQDPAIGLAHQGGGRVRHHQHQQGRQVVGRPLVGQPEQQAHGHREQQLAHAGPLHVAHRAEQFAAAQDHEQPQETRRQHGHRERALEQPGKDADQGSRAQVHGLARDLGRHLGLAPQQLGARQDQGEQPGHQGRGAQFSGKKGAHARTSSSSRDP